MELQGEEVCLTIQDDGLGLDLEQTKQAGHYGLAGMRERAELAGGQMEIGSQPGKGTCVQLKLNGMGRHANNHL
jgi:NarL family two-component system sensor histidine kinase YdfH